jgi:phosphate transport system substrate-binding protein
VKKTVPYLDRSYHPRGRASVRARAAIAMAAVLVASLCGAGGVAQAQSAPNDLSTPTANLTGAGSTFDQPFFTLAFYDYYKLNPDVTVAYASIGSGGGIAQFQANTVNFGASDVPMAASDLAKDTGGAALQIPVALGGEAISYNLPGIKSGLHLTGSLLANIYLGKVKNWDNIAIKKLNPGVDLPNRGITVVHRSDGSGTTYIFTNYLAVVSKPWASGPGVGKSPDWPVGVGGKGNEGVAGEVADIKGSIGYVELDYALESKFTFAAMQNAAGKFVLPSIRTVAADAAENPNVTPTNFPIVNEPGAASYPISGYSWALVYVKQTNTDVAIALARVLDWLTHAGQADAQSLDYVPLPANIQALAQTDIAQILTPAGTEAWTASF